MLLSWKIKYLDSRDKQIKNRDLLLDTDTLDAVTKGIVEAIYESQDIGNRRDILKYRHLFHEVDNYEDEFAETCQNPFSIYSVGPYDYFEDENAKEITSKEMSRIITGRNDTIMLPAGTPAYRIKYIFAEKPPIQIDKIELTMAQLGVLGYFVRDLQEMISSAFYKEGAGTLSGRFPDEMVLETSVTDEEIRSFVTIFRRLYMQGEPCNFLKAVVVFGDALQGYPLAEYILGIGCEYKIELEQPPKFVPYVGADKIPFPRKRLMDVHIYTQYAHQPCPQREKQYRECLVAFGNSRPLLTWVFLNEMRISAMHIRNAGVYIADFFKRYCLAHKLNPEIIPNP